MRHYFLAGPSTEHFRPSRNQRGRNRQPDVCGRAEAAGRPDLSPSNMVSATHTHGVHIFPVATARAVCVSGTFDFGSADSYQRGHCTEDAQTPGDSIVPTRLIRISIRYIIDTVVRQMLQYKSWCVTKVNVSARNEYDGIDTNVFSIFNKEDG